MTGCKQAVYQYTAAQIEEIKHQAVKEQKQYLDKAIDEEWKKRTEAVSGETEEERMKKYGLRAIRKTGLRGHAAHRHSAR